MTLISPKSETAFVTKLLDKLKVEFEPEQIPVIVESDAKINNCFLNVEKKIKRDGGKAHYGWAIFQSEILIEAIWHAVWENDNGDLIDITPKEINFDFIMFVSKNNFTYNGQLIDNIRINITSNPLVDDFILICEALEKFFTYGKHIGEEEMIIPEPARKFVLKYTNLKHLFLQYLNEGARPKHKCFCGEQKSYKSCHGKSIKSLLRNDLKEASIALGTR